MTINLDNQGLIPAIVQDMNTKEVLMLGYVNPESLNRTIESGHVWFYSRSRQELWHKGETSGSYLNLKAAWVDCDGDTILLQVNPDGPVCHTGNTTCFFTQLENNPRYQAAKNGAVILDKLFAVIQNRKHNPSKDSYTAELLQSGLARVAQKVIEEAGEASIAAVQGGGQHLTLEVADLFYHTLVLLAASDISLEMVWDELQARRNP
ncbi:bifunctional phosphoribosyl-AMP cyclohydrolase/phosphoribosyl-ATP diphosphatase HisIE [Dehalococcoidia bacterium]|nr:bifunctional phosphoribosyl-AMP cyclohydrolase/phosphoribosyl-ATP diphosphatase HisIE [Dehalococcoidia bacterium]